MGVNNISFEEAMTSRVAAAQYLRSTNVPLDEKGQLIKKWGEDFVKQAMSVDSTKYEISDDDYESAKQAGKDATKDSVGYDGGKTYRGVVDAAESAGAAAGGYFGGNAIAGALGTQAAKKGAAEAGSKSLAKNMSDVATAVLTSLVAAKYYIAKPNKDQHEAGEHLLANELPEGQAALNETQETLEDTSEKVTELTEEADEKNEEANTQIEENKTLFDFYRQQYEALKAKKEAGGTLTPDEVALMKQLAPQLGDLGEDITTISEETSAKVNDLYGEIDDYQDAYDESAESIAEVEGLTDYAEGFDENTRTMMYVEGAAQGVNSVSAGVAAAKLWAKNGLSFGTLTPFAVMATAASLASLNATKEQISWAGDMSDEIDARREVQDLGTETSDIYDEELENYAGNIELVEDLELEIPEDMEVPEDTQAGTPVTPAPAAGITPTDEGKNEDPNKKKSDEVK